MAKTKAKRVGDFSLRADTRRGTRDDGRQYHRIVKYEGGKEVTAWSGWATPAEAQKQAATLIVEPEAIQPKNQEIQTVCDLCECFLGDQTEGGDWSPRTLENATTRLKVVVSFLGEVLVPRLTLSDMEGYIRKRKVNVAPGTIWLELRFLSQAWGWAQKRGLIPNREFPAPRLKNEVVRERYTPEDADILRVLAVLRPRSDWRYLAVLLLAETGARLGEIANLKRKDIDREKMLIRVDGKTGKREIPITSEVYAEIRPSLLGDPEGWLLGVRPVTIRKLNCGDSKGSTNYHLAAACEDAGVSRFTPHGLRRAFVIRCFRAGLDPGVEASLAGHSIEMALKTYRQVRQDEKREAIHRISLTRAT